jgi:hypothetical protein
MPEPPFGLNSWNGTTFETGTAGVGERELGGPARNHLSLSRVRNSWIHTMCYVPEDHPYFEMKQQGDRPHCKKGKKHRVETVGIAGMVEKKENLAPAPWLLCGRRLFFICENLCGLVRSFELLKVFQRALSVLDEEFCPLVKLPKNKCDHA